MKKPVGARQQTSGVSGITAGNIGLYGDSAAEAIYPTFKRGYR